MPYDNANSGTLNQSTEKRSERSPDWWGSISISGEVLEAAKAGKPIRISGWNKTGSRGDFVSIKASVGEERERRPTVNEAVAAITPKKTTGHFAGQPVTATHAETIHGGSQGAAADFSDDIPF